jgi:hypothetical protein
MSDLFGSVDTGAISDFLRDFVYETDPVVNRQVLERRPDLLEPPLNYLVAPFFEREIEVARESNDLLKLLPILRRQELFLRCQEVGVDRAFEGLAKDDSWPSPSTN